MGIVYDNMTLEQRIQADSLLEIPKYKILPDQRRVDLIDLSFGDWKVVQYAGHKKWVCICSCGKISKVLGVELRSGRSTSCGHSRKDESLIGKYFGYLEVIEKIDGRHHKCICHCECGGTEKIVATYDLKSGKVKSCGINTTRKESIIGKKFNHWTVLESLGEGKYKCECDCEYKTIGVVTRADLVAGRSKSCGHANSYISKSRNLRTIEQIYMVENASNLREAISKYTNGAPNLYDIQRLIGLSRRETINILNKYNLISIIDLKSRNNPYINEIQEFIESLGISNIIRDDINIVQGQKLDIYIPSHRFAINVYPVYSQIGEVKTNQNSAISGFKSKIHILHIFEHEWLNPVKQQIIKDFIKNKLTTEKYIVYAKRCHVEVADTKKAIEFANKYHLQGWVNAEIKYGLYIDNELIGLMTFGKPRFNNKAEYELLRLIWKSDVNVVGGADKLFKTFIREYNPKSVLSYCDISKFNGGVYFKLGFKMTSKDITPPNYVWVNPITMDTIPRYKTQKQKLLKLGLGNIEDTENSIMERQGYIKVYDSGNARFMWNKE